MCALDSVANRLAPFHTADSYAERTLRAALVSYQLVPQMWGSLDFRLRLTRQVMECWGLCYSGKATN